MMAGRRFMDAGFSSLVYLAAEAKKREIAVRATQPGRVTSVE
jgi:hypothetical protein